MSYKKIQIQDFVTFVSNQDGYSNVVQGDVGWVNVDINHSLTYLDKLTKFEKSDIEEIKKINYNNYDLDIGDNFVVITDLDYNRKSINPNYKNWTERRFGNTDSIWIYKIEDEWFLVVIARSNKIPFHKNPYVMANRNSNFEFYKCDQIEGLKNLLETKLK